MLEPCFVAICVAQTKQFSTLHSACLFELTDEYKNTEVINENSIVLRHSLEKTLNELLHMKKNQEQTDVNETKLKKTGTSNLNTTFLAHQGSFLNALRVHL